LEYQVVLNVGIAVEVTDEVFGCDVAFLVLIEFSEGLAKIEEGTLEHAGPHVLHQLLRFEVQLPRFSV
jgi:hypothetical protein